MSVAEKLATFVARLVVTGGVEVGVGVAAGCVNLVKVGSVPSMGLGIGVAVAVGVRVAVGVGVAVEAGRDGRAAGVGRGLDVGASLGVGVGVAARRVNVVKVGSVPYLVPPLFVATIQKSLSVLAAEASSVAADVAAKAIAIAAMFLVFMMILRWVESLARETSPVDLRAADWRDVALIVERCIRSALRSQAKNAMSRIGIETESTTSKRVPT